MQLTISLTSPLPPETLLGSVALEDGSSVHVLIEGGWFQGELPARPLRLVCTAGIQGPLVEPIAEARTDDSKDAAAAPAFAAIRTSSPPPASFDEPGNVPDPRNVGAQPPSAAPRITVDISTLFGAGVEVPADGVVRLHLLWLAPCDGVPTQPKKESRFGSAEHSLCATRVGLDEKGQKLTLRSVRAHFTGQTQFNVGGKKLDFGMIIALAGDFYAHLDEKATTEFSWAWPPIESMVGWVAGDYRHTTLAGDSEEAVTTLHKHIDQEAVGIQFAGVVQAIETIKLRFPMRRYLALASQNFCHFAGQNRSYSDKDNAALSLYRAYHKRAIAEARAAGARSDRKGLDAALVVDAFGCHFLTDLFASGHIRTPRAILGERFGIAMGALVMSKRMHDEDNKDGLWVTPFRPESGKRRVVWRAFGDDSLFSDPAKVHMAQVQEAVRRSAAEVFAAYCEGATGMSVTLPNSAEDLVPVPLLPGEGPDPNADVSPDGQPFPNHPKNHRPLYKILDDGRVAERFWDGYFALEAPWTKTAAPGQPPITEPVK